MLSNRFAAFAAAHVLSALFALSATAAPLVLWLQPNGSFGFGDASVAAASNAGLQLLPDSTFISNSGTTRIAITTPSPITGTNVQNGGFANLSRGSSTWTVTPVDRDYDNLWVVIQGHEFNNFPGGPTDSHYSQNQRIGLIIDTADPNWALVHPSGFPTVTYLAYHVGDLAQGDGFGVPINYAVAKALKLVQSNPNLYEFPTYHVNFLELAVPEPVALLLLGTGGTLLAIRKRRRAA